MVELLAAITLLGVLVGNALVISVLRRIRNLERLIDRITPGKMEITSFAITTDGDQPSAADSTKGRDE